MDVDDFGTGGRDLLQQHVRVGTGTPGHRTGKVQSEFIEIINRETHLFHFVSLPVIVFYQQADTKRKINSKKDTILVDAPSQEMYPVSLYQK
ncbi:hypothetical protein [Acidiphilium acidophilum]|uniref:Uncharacterized protein n=1 Tax=Acidiphilium acidophilum TaxID=76588 RepID=A0AAW9DSB1_ACIAO|nr:hypothetical protein [Acidiphilium acidophilum]MDX5932099.1 hypothetical protein [Acidiphilium acidophilum]GBQ27622.1 hypothetical protein AA700_1643 [Acidiphilium acidophilum DSM 700]